MRLKLIAYSAAFLQLSKGLNLTMYDSEIHEIYVNEADATEVLSRGTFVRGAYFNVCVQNELDLIGLSITKVDGSEIDG